MAEELKNNGYENIKAIQIDVTNSVTVLAAKETIEKEKGKLDILINNAGILGGMEQNATNTNITIFKEVYEVNLFGVITGPETVKSTAAFSVKHT
ncbi:SDR family NAD(P)-dependent oxidoreductase [Flavobacterium restrictum]|uniref:SDR family NAD(P)-dependent oxidoreductase n=1 Tax=Flavobacterium restrictum TaxID=2594428 RepID=UPI001F424CE7|nr:SDR family NAD(P)-dependent oxidoreductase [Flavobacterium restrictum]